MSPASPKKQHTIVALTLLLFGILFSMLALVNHFQMRTVTYDIGIYTHAIYRYSHLLPADCSLFMPEGGEQLLLSDHFDLLLPLLSPLSYLFGTYTLFIVQIIAILFGAYGVYRLIMSVSGKHLLSWAAMLAMLSCFGVWHALGSDYHSNVIAASLLPWFIYLCYSKRHAVALVVMLIMCITKETSALWVIFVIFGLMLDKKARSSKDDWNWLIVFLTVCIVYVIVGVITIMPNLGGSSPGFWRYTHMGDTLSGVILWIIEHPWQTMINIFTNYKHEAKLEYLKLEFFISILLSGGLLALLKPNYLLMVVFPLAIKMLSRDGGFWGVGYHYNIEICIVVITACFMFLAERCKHSESVSSEHKQINKQALLYILAFAVTAFTAATSWQTINYSKMFIYTEKMALLSGKHYVRPDFNISFARKMMR